VLLDSFAAPEVLRGERYDGRQTDIWALGVLGYVMLCGESPFWTKEEATFGAFHDCQANGHSSNRAAGLGDTTRAAIALKAKVTSSEESELMADAIDLVSHCLAASAVDRPTAMQVCRHRFVARQYQDSHPELLAKAWTGKRGWEQACNGG
jgi:serine/threonine protein kinase